MVRFAFALVGAVQPAPSHTISEYVPSAEVPVAGLPRRPAQQHSAATAFDYVAALAPGQDLAPEDGHDRHRR